LGERRAAFLHLCLSIRKAEMVYSGPKFDPPSRPFDPEHPYDDPVALFEQREQRAREKIVQVEKAKVSSQEFSFCLRDTE
jgi:hypothetical protein